MLELSLIRVAAGIPGGGIGPPLSPLPEDVGFSGVLQRNPYLLVLAHVRDLVPYCCLRVPAGVLRIEVLKHLRGRSSATC